jgi:hypothetical protein
MSVVTGKRKPGKLQVLKLVQELAAYTLRVCKNEKVFPKSYRWLLTQKLVNEAVDTLGCVTRANSVKVETSADYEYRRQQQIEAHAHVNSLLSFVDLAYNVLNIDSRRVEYWTGLAVEADNKILAWANSTKRQYKELGKECGEQ